MIILNNNNWVVSFNGVEDPVTGKLNFYDGDRVILQIRNTGIVHSDDEKLITFVLNDRRASWYCTDNLSLDVDTTYLFKALDRNTDITMYLYTENADTLQITKTVRVIDGISPQTVMIPKPLEMIASLPTTAGWYDKGNYVAAPNVLVAPAEGTYPHIFIEVTDPSWLQCKNGTWSAPESYSSNGNLYTEEILPSATGLRISDKNDYYHTRIEKASKCEELVLVCWKSQFGNWRQCYFPVRKIASATSGSNQLQQLGANYATLKERECTVDLFIDGLTRHSLWWYNDLILSGEVYMMKYDYNMGLTQNLDQLWMYGDTIRCDVTTNKYTMVDGDRKFQSFQATLKYRQYNI